MNNTIDYEQCCKSILEDIENLERKIKEKKEEFKKLKFERMYTKKIETEENEIFADESIEEQDNSFEEEIAFFMINYRLLRENFTDSEIKAILPSKRHKEYNNILLRLSLESVKEIKDLKELLKTDNLEDEEKNECERLINIEQRKIGYIRDVLLDPTKSDPQEPEEAKNNIILVPTISGNIRITDELEHIPSEYYESFKELINSIVDGTFKNVKTFTNDNNLVGVSEVKAFKTRVVFTRLNYNTYALITAFIKKSDNDKLYHESLASKVFDYFLIENDLKRNATDEQFLNANEIQVQNMWNVLSFKDEEKRNRKVK